MNVVLYSTGCRRCKIIEEMLIRAHISYSVCSDKTVFEELNFIDAPHLQVGDKIMNFSEAFKWIYNNYLR